MYILRSNYSNNSIALIQWAHEQQLEDLTVVYVDTGWSAEGWLDYVEMCETFVESKEFQHVRLKSPSPFADVMEMKSGFPTRRYQWCSLHLKGVPFLNWVEDFDPDTQATILLPRMNADNNAESNVEEFNECCEYHGNRRVWHPLYDADYEMRNALIQRATLQPLPHRSLECAPCINSTVLALRNLSSSDVEKTEELEEDLEATMFSPQDCGGATGICKIVEWAKTADEDALQYKFGCSASFGCGS